VAVLGGTGDVLAVVDMEDGNLVFSQNTVKFFHHVVEMVDDVISGITRVAGVEAYP
jgi:hypothetical protein